MMELMHSSGCLIVVFIVVCVVVYSILISKGIVCFKFSKFLTAVLDYPVRVIHLKVHFSICLVESGA